MNDGEVIGVRQRIVDPKTFAQVGIDYEHHEVHQGDAFIVETNATLDDTEELILAFETGLTTDPWFHLVPYYTSSGAALFEWLRGPTITADSGTQLPVFNRDENSSNESNSLSIETVQVSNEVTKDPTITVDGVVISSVQIGQGQNRQAGRSRASLERLLLPGTIYALRITSAANGNVVQLSMDWYEHTNKS